MDDNPIELTPLDPTSDELRWRSLQQRVRAAAAPELARRAGSLPGIEALALWSRPILAAAAVLAVLSVAVFRLNHPGLDEGGAGTVAEALGFPIPVAEWLADERSPDEDDLLLAFERRVR